ncbi:MAG: formyltransferase family protein, partial [Actinomycetota bacterium]
GAALGVVVAYGRIIPLTVLSQLPMINVHFSLLPRWRGAAPVERALLAGDDETGICIMRVEEGLDTGVVYDRAVVPIRPHHTLGLLRGDLVNASIAPLLRVVANGCGHGEVQQG